MEGWIRQAIQEQAHKLALSTDKSVKEYEDEWVSGGEKLSGLGGDGYCLKVGELRVGVASLLRALQRAGLYVPESEEA